MSLFGFSNFQRATLRVLIDAHIDGLFDRNSPEQAENAVMNMLCRTPLGAQLCRDDGLGDTVRAVGAIFKRYPTNESARVAVKYWAWKRLGV